MCLHHIKKIRFYNNAIILTITILLACFSGLSDVEILHNLAQIISDAFIKIFKCISLPVIGLSIIVTLSSYSSEHAISKLVKKAILYTISTTIIAATVSCLLYLAINPSNSRLDILGNDSVLDAQSIQESGNKKKAEISYLKHLGEIIPSNIFSPFLEHKVISLLLISIVFGIAIRYISDLETKKIVIHFFQGIHSTFLIVTKWIILLIPIALYGFITVTIVELKNGVDIKSIFEYLAVVILANLVQGFIILPIWLKVKGIKPFDTMKKMLPALSMAFFSKSSAGTLPVTIDTAEKQLKISPQISRFILPLCTSINMNGCAAFIFTTVIYLMQNHGIEISLYTMILWIFISTIAAVGNAGVPMGCFFLSASLLASMDIPIMLLGIILPFYSIIDMVETALNVWSDSCVAKVLDDEIKFRKIV